MIKKIEKYFDQLPSTGNNDYMYATVKLQLHGYLLAKVCQTHRQTDTPTKYTERYRETNQYPFLSKKCAITSADFRFHLKTCKQYVSREKVNTHAYLELQQCNISTIPV